jgi:hypothetical protein
MPTTDASHRLSQGENVMELKQMFAVGFARLYQDLDIAAVLSGIGVAWFATTVSRLIDGPHDWQWFGAAVAASICSALLTRRRERARSSSGA